MSGEPPVGDSREFLDSEIGRIESWLEKLRSGGHRDSGVECLYEGQLAKMKALRAELYGEASS